MVESLEQRMEQLNLSASRFCHPLMVAPTTKLVRVNQLFLEDLQKLEVGAKIWRHHDESQTSGRFTSEVVFLGLEDCESYQGYKYQSTAFQLLPDYALLGALSDVGILPYKNGTWNHYNWLSSEPYPE